MSKQLALPPSAGIERQHARIRVARRLQWACARFPASLAADDAKALVLAELVLREIEDAAVETPAREQGEEAAQ